MRKPNGWKEMSVGQRLASLRHGMGEELGTQVAVSAATGISRQTIRAAENDQPVSSSTLSHLALFYGLKGSDELTE